MVKKLINKLSGISARVKECFMYNPVQVAMQEIMVEKGYENIPKLLKKSKKRRDYKVNNNS